MNWDDLRFVLALSRRASLTAAARELGVNHSTVSRRVRALEDTVGAKLFDKLPDGYVATAAGDEVIAVAERIETEIHGVDRSVLGRDERLSGSLRFTTTDAVAALHADDIAAFRRLYPGIDLEAAVDSQMQSLSKREADVALRMTNKPAEHLVGRKVVRAEFALYASRSLVERMGPKAGLADYPWLAWDERMGARLTERWMRRHVPTAQIACHVDSTMFMIAAAEAGMGLSFLMCAQADANPLLVRMRPVEPGFGMDVWLLAHPDLRQNARVRAFMDHMAAALSSRRAAYAGETAAAA